MDNGLQYNALALAGQLVLAPISLKESCPMGIAWLMGQSRVFSIHLKQIGGNFTLLAKLYSMASKSSPW